MIQKVFIIFLLSLFSNCGVSLRSEGEYLIKCGDGLREITSSNLCDGIPDCDDESDESNLDLCELLSKNKCDYDKRNFMIKCSPQNLNGEYDQYNSNTCKDIVMACIFQQKCFSFHVEELCELVGHKLKAANLYQEISTETLKSKEAKEGNETYEVIKFFEEAMNKSVKGNFGECPPLFIPFGDTGKCVFLFTPMKVSWNEAQMFCESIGGSLGIFDNIDTYKKLLKFFQEKEMESRFWIGAKYSVSENETSLESEKAWTWLNGEPVTMGAPFWNSFPDETSKKNKLCKERTLMPRFPGRECLSILEENFYHFSDEWCTDKLSPLCMTKKIQTIFPNDPAEEHDPNGPLEVNF